MKDAFSFSSGVYISKWEIVVKGVKKILQFRFKSVPLLCNQKGKSKMKKDLMKLSDAEIEEMNREIEDDIFGIVLYIFLLVLLWSIFL